MAYGTLSEGVGVDNYKEFEELIERTVSFFKTFDINKPIRIIAHLDCDGLASCSILTKLLLLEKRKFVISVVHNLKDSFLKELASEYYENYIFLDLGSSQIIQIEKYLQRKKIIIIDHCHIKENHVKENFQSERIVHLNPFLCGIEGHKEISCSGVSYLLSAKINNQITLVQAYLPGLPLNPETFDGVISNSLLHHLPNPNVFWEEIKHLGKNGTAVFIMDLLRPASKETARAIVEQYASNEHPALKEDFYNSLLAAFTLDEIKAQLKEVNLINLNVEIISDRHWVGTGHLV